MKNSVKNNNWVAVLIGGILVAGLGIYSIFFPGVSLLTFGIMLSVILLYQGTAEVIYSLANRKHHNNWGWVLAYGLLNLFFGGYLMFYPGESVVVLSYTILFILMFRSINAIGTSFDMQSIHDNNWIWVLLLGLAGLFISFYLFDFPIATAEFSLLWIASGLLIIGLFIMSYAVRLKKAYH